MGRLDMARDSLRSKRKRGGALRRGTALKGRRCEKQRGEVSVEYGALNHRGLHIFT